MWSFRVSSGPLGHDGESGGHRPQRRGRRPQLLLHPPQTTALLGDDHRQMDEGTIKPSGLLQLLSEKRVCGRARRVFGIRTKTLAEGRPPAGRAVPPHQGGPADWKRDVRLPSGARFEGGFLRKKDTPVCGRWGPTLFPPNSYWPLVCDSCSLNYSKKEKVIIINFIYNSLHSWKKSQSAAVVWIFCYEYSISDTYMLQEVKPSWVGSTLAF